VNDARVADFFVADQLYVRRLFEGRNMPTADVLQAVFFTLSVGPSGCRTFFVSVSPRSIEDFFR